MLAGVTAIELKVGGATVRLVEPVTVPLVAEIGVVPGERPVARPALLMLAIAEVVAAQVTVEVMLAVVPSL